jgi:polyhydroxyalkanoate synthesis regulator phasin
MRHLSQDELVLYYYHEEGGVERRAAEEHVRGCDACRQELASLTVALAALETLPVPERDASYGAEVWARLRPHLQERPRRRGQLFFPLRAWALAASMAALLIIAFWGGKVWQQRHTPQAVAIPPAARQRVLMVALGDHLDRAQMLLVEVMHQEAEGPVNVSQAKQVAQDLVASNRLYRQAAVRDGEPGMANLLDDLERVLLHIAHSPNEISAEDLAVLQRQIVSQGILFKVRVIELEAHEKQQATPPRNSEGVL